MSSTIVYFALLASLLVMSNGAPVLEHQVKIDDGTGQHLKSIQIQPAPLNSALNKTAASNSRAQMKYTLIPGSFTYYEAVNVCYSYGAIPAIAWNDDDNHQIQTILNVSGAWLGLKRSEGCRNGWTWENGQCATYMAWAPGEPGDINERCGEIVYAWGKLWNDTSCNKKQAAICQTWW